MNANYPVADNNRFISMASAEILAAKKPATWFPVAQDGTMDFGYDFSIHVGVGREVLYTVRAQLKGTTKPSLIENGRTLSYGLERSTLNLYSNSQDEILFLLAVVVLQEDKKVDLAASKIYWQWIAPELVRLWGSRYSQNVTDQQTFTVHVPTSQELTPKLEIVEYLDQRIGEARASEEVQAIAIARGIVPPGATDPLQQFARVFRETSSLDVGIDAHASEFNVVELDTELDKVTAFLRVGLTRQAEEALRQLDRTQFEQRPKLLASVLSIEGKIAVQRRRRVDAIGLLERAHALDATEPHLLALEEMRFLEAVDKADTAVIDTVASRLASVQSDEGLSLLARVLVALRRFDEANAIVDRITSSAKTMSRLVVMSGQSRWSEVQHEATKALERSDLPRRETMGIRLVAARACWSQALSTARLAPDDQLMPLTGAAGLDAHFAQAAWQFSKQCLEDLKELGWQPNTELIAPIALASAAATGHHTQALDLMREAGTARPEYRELQENLELLAIAAGELEIALEANRRQPQTHAVLVRRSMHLHHAKEFSECVGTALSCLATIDQAVAQTPMALVMGTAAASRLGRAGDAERLMEAVRSKEAWGEYEYFGRFVLANEARDSETPVHLHALRDGLERFPSSRLLAANLFSNLNASAPEIAAEVVELAGRLRVVAELAQDDAYRLVDALLKLERWAESYCSPPAALSDHAVIGPRLSAASAGDRPRHRTPPPASQCCPPQYFGRHVRRVRRMFGEGQPQEPNPLETSRALFA